MAKISEVLRYKQKANDRELISRPRHRALLHEASPSHGEIEDVDRAIAIDVRRRIEVWVLGAKQVARTHEGKIEDVNGAIIVNVAAQEGDVRELGRFPQQDRIGSVRWLAR